MKHIPGTYSTHDARCQLCQLSALLQIRCISALQHGSAWLWHRANSTPATPTLSGSLALWLSGLQPSLWTLDRAIYEPLSL